EDPARMVLVVDEIQQIAEHDEGVGAVGGTGQCLGVAVDVGHDVDSHADPLSYSVGGTPGRLPSSKVSFKFKASCLAAFARRSRARTSCRRVCTPTGSARRK